MNPQRPKRKISQTFARWLLVCVVLALAISTLFIWFLQTYLAFQDTQSILRLNIADVQQDIVDASNKNLLNLTHKMAQEINGLTNPDSEYLEQMLQDYDVSEINLISSDGIIYASTYPDFLGYDMASGDQSKEFLVLLDGQTEYVQSYQPVSYDSSISRKYAGVALESGGFVEVGYDASRFHQDIAYQVVGATENRHVGENGCVILCDESWNIISAPGDFEGKNLSEIGLNIDISEGSQGECFTATVFEESSYCMYLETEGYYAIAVTPVADTALSRNVSVAVTLAMEFIVFAVLFVMIYVLLNRQITENIRKINSALSEITGGNLDVTVDVHINEEFSSLSNDINTTVAALKESIAEAERRIDQELEFARTIQHAALPSVFPPYPNRSDFDIYACMDTAKEVGGDFYDFYLLSEDTLVFLVADVSGKGIPAALFMMQAKTLLKSLAESGLDASEIFNRANDSLCQNNSAEMFVTAWMGMLNLKTGLLTYVNAGHNPPILRGEDGSTRFVKSPAGLVLAGMEGMIYRSHTLQLQPGDSLYLYTDGVTEATNSQEELFSEQRLLECLDRCVFTDPRSVCNTVREDVDRFVGETSQFDDITMLSLVYKRGSVVKELNVSAVPENLAQVTAFVEEQLESFGCPMKTQMQVTLAVEEIFVNIASYAYDPQIGPALIRTEVHEDPLEVVITFIDKGKPHDPLQRGDPDISLDAEDREIGGLGIFMVKQTMDDISYEYTNGKNILRIVKRW